MVIRVGILASCANMSKQKGTLSPGPEGFFKTQSNQTYFFFFFPEFGTEVETGTSIDVVCCCVSSVILSYCFKYDFPDLVPVGWGTSACAVKAYLSFSESLREAIITLSSSGKTEITLQDLPFELNFFESHCLSWARSGCTHKIYLQPCLKVWKKSIRDCDLWHVPNSRVTMFEVTFFCSDFKVRTPASTRA